jgi:hypothetical protein
MRRLRPAAFLLAFVPCLPCAASASILQLRAEPRAIYLEHVGTGQAVEFELRLANTGDQPLEIGRIEVSAYDAGDHLLLRRFIDDNGVRPSLGVLDTRTVPPHGALTVFNPFPRFAAELPIARLHYEVEASPPDDAAPVRGSVDVRPRDYRNASHLRLPLDGRLISYDGHDYLAHHRRFDVHFPPIAAMGFRTNFMRYGYDLVPVDDAGAMYHDRFEDNRAWLGFGRPILAVADGTVVAAVDDRPDNRHFDESRLARDHSVLFGNYVVIDHGHGEFGVYAHAQQGSVRVRPGQRVQRGEAIARIGASGSAFFPHLHFQLQTGPDTSAEGLPSYFDDYDWIVGERRVPREQATPDTGEIVESRAASPGRQP